MKRVQHEPGYVLHRYDWSESSLIVEVFTRRHGRVALVAKGAKRPSSNFRPVLLPLQPLLLSWSGDAEIGTLKAAEWGGGLVMPAGEALLQGYYANELLLRLQAREDACPRLFDAYAQLVHVLASPAAGLLAASALRAFELLLLREGGHLPALDVQTLTLAPLVGGVNYRLVAEAGLREDGTADDSGLPAVAWRALADASTDDGPFAALLDVLASWPPPERNRLRRQLGELLDYHCGSAGLRTRQLMLDLQRFKTMANAP